MANDEIPEPSQEMMAATSTCLVKGFSLAMTVARQMGCIDEAELAARRLMAYDPGHKTISGVFPEYQRRSELLVHRIQELVSDRDVEEVEWEHVGYCYTALGDFPNALAAFSKVVGEDSRKLEFSFVFGCVNHHFRYYDQASIHYRRVIAMTKDPALKSDATFRLALAERSLGNDEGAITLFRGILETPPNGLRKEDVTLQIAYTYQKMGRFNEANPIYTDLRMNFPNLLPITQQYVWFQYITAKKNSLIQIAEILNRALALHPNDPVLLLQSARVAMKRDDMATAYQSYRNCIAFWSDQPAFWCCLGNLYYRNDQVQDAIVAFQRALYIKKDMAEAWLNLGLIFENQNDPVNAHTVYASAVRICQNSKELHERLVSLTRNGQRKPIAQYQLIEIDDSRFFIQIPEQFAQDYVSAVPLLKPANFTGCGDLDIDDLCTLPRTLFVK